MFIHNCGKNKYLSAPNPPPSALPPNCFRVYPGAGGNRKPGFVAELGMAVRSLEVVGDTRDEQQTEATCIGYNTLDLLSSRK